MPIRYEKLDIPGGIELPGIGTIKSEVNLSIPQIGFTVEKDEKGNEIEVFVGLDLEEMLSVLEPQMDKEGKVTKSVEEIAVTYFNNGLKAAMRSGGYASARSMTNVAGTKEQKEKVKNLKKTLDSFIDNFGMSPEQSAAAVINLPGVQDLLQELRTANILVETKPTPTENPVA